MYVITVHHHCLAYYGGGERCTMMFMFCSVPMCWEGPSSLATVYSSVLRIVHVCGSNPWQVTALFLLHNLSLYTSLPTTMELCLYARFLTEPLLTLLQSIPDFHITAV